MECPAALAMALCKCACQHEIRAEQGGILELLPHQVTKHAMPSDAETALMKISRSQSMQRPLLLQLHLGTHQILQGLMLLAEAWAMHVVQPLVRPVMCMPAHTAWSVLQQKRLFNPRLSMCCCWHNYVAPPCLREATIKCGQRPSAQKHCWVLTHGRRHTAVCSSVHDPFWRIPSPAATRHPRHAPSTSADWNHRHTSCAPGTPQT